MDSVIPRNYVEYMEHINKNYREKTGIYEKINGDFVGKTFGNLYDDVQTLAKKLYTLNLKDKKIAIMGKNCYDWIVSYFAVVTYVGVAIPIDNNWTAFDFKNLLEMVDIDCIICDEQSLDKVYQVCLEKDIKTIEFKRELEIFLSEQLTVNYVELDYEKNPEELSVLSFTSGTSSKPKGVMLSQSNLFANEYGIKELIPYATDDRVLLTLPLSHILNVNIYMAYQLLEGISVYLSDQETLEEDLMIVRPTTLPAVPFMLEKLAYTFYSQDIKNQKKIDKNRELSNKLRKQGKDKREKIFKDIHYLFGGKLRYIFVGGTNLKDTVTKFYDDLGITILQGYGLTECSPVVTLNSYNNNSLTTLGKPLLGEKTKILDANESGIGEIAVKGKNIMLGYYNNKELTQKSFTEDGYFKTGDLGYFDHTGNLHLVGRKKRLITTPTGNNVYPDEIEKLIMNSGKISKVVVYLDKAHLNVTIVTNIAEGEVIAILKDVNKRLPKYKKIKDFQIKRDMSWK